MPRPVPLTQDDIDWLHANHRDHTPLQLANRFNCCVDTMKRILMRHELRHFPGAKYATSSKASFATWTRPCLHCGKPQRRPRGWYFCRRCRQTRGYADD